MLTKATVRSPACGCQAARIDAGPGVGLAGGLEVCCEGLGGKFGRVDLLGETLSLARCLPEPSRGVPAACVRLSSNMPGLAALDQGPLGGTPA
mmetsp:Transcript_24383/g.56193  ORF Transcript_24383/g.56193 Transcript_24383/m.56193 type:complete len:93 (+) Transcript_24383:804-1082(+)